MSEPTILDYARIVVKRYRLVTACILAATLSSLIVTLAMPKIYLAEATIYVLQHQPSALTNVLGQVGFQLPGIGGSVDQVLAVLKSRSLAEAVVEEVNFPVPFKTAAASPVGQAVEDDRVEILRGMLSVKERRGLVTIRVEGPDPALATEIANAYVQLLDRFLLKATSKRKQFIEGQLEGAFKEMAAAEEELREFQERNAMLGIPAEMEESVKALLDLEAEEMKSSGVLAENASMLRETGSLAEIAALQTQRAGLLARRAELQNQIRETEGRLRLVPAQAMMFARLKRDLELQLKRYALLQEQYQLASIAEKQEEAVFQTVDRAVVPWDPVRPRLAVNLSLGLITGVALGVVGALMLESRKPDSQPRMNGSGES